MYLDTWGDRVFLHSSLDDPTKPSMFKHYRRVLDCLCEELHEKGVEQLYTVADSQPNADFCASMGFDTNLEYFDNFEIMVRPTKCP